MSMSSPATRKASRTWLVELEQRIERLEQEAGLEWPEPPAPKYVKVLPEKGMTSGVPTLIYTYEDGSNGRFSVGDKVDAPTRYGSMPGVVVAVNQDRSDWYGTLRTLTTANLS
jgi:hypothetical protein